LQTTKSGRRLGHQLKRDHFGILVDDERDGYIEVAAVTVRSEVASGCQAFLIINKHNLPVQLTRLIGHVGASKS
jgi:hypothetical protein